MKSPKTFTYMDQFVQKLLFHTILITGFLLDEHDFSWLVNNRAVFYIQM